MEDFKAINIPSVGNYYGGLNLKRENGQYFWSIESYDGDDWEKIPDYLGDALYRFVKES